MSQGVSIQCLTGDVSCERALLGSALLLLNIRHKVVKKKIYTTSLVGM